MAIYGDRVEVTASGTPQFGLTPEKLFASHEYLPWNPLTARTFNRPGLIDGGMGARHLEDAGGCVKMCFRHAKGTATSDNRSGAERGRVGDTPSGKRQTSAERQRAPAAGEALRALRARFGGATIDEILEMRNKGRS